MNKAHLKKLREELRKKDREIVRLLNERAELSIQVGKIKNSNSLKVYDPSQEDRVYDHLREINKGPLSNNALKNIFGEIISSSRALQAPTTVAYLGPEASFSYLAALLHFGKRWKRIGFPGEWCPWKTLWKVPSSQPWTG
jgi:chorismate mutase/prephenate dehydratase